MGWGCPIRRSGGQRVLASRPGLSQRATSFVASQCQGIHQMPLKRLILAITATYRDKPHLGSLTSMPATALLKTLCFLQKATGCVSPRPIRRSPGNSTKPTALAGPRFTHIHNDKQPKRRTEGRRIRALPEAATPMLGFPDFVALPLSADLRHQNGGGERDRTDGLLLAKQALYQLSYTPSKRERRRSTRA